MTRFDFLDAELDALADKLADRVLRRLGHGEAPRLANSSKLLSKSELALAVRRSAATIDRWATEGMPFDDMGTYRMYDLDKCRTWAARRPKPGRPVKAAPHSGAVTSPGLPPGVELRTRARRAS